MAAVPDIGALIVSSPEIRGGRPRVAGTGVTVMRVVSWYRLGLTPEEIADEIALSLAQVYAALTYYHANRKQIDADIADEEAEYDRLSTPNARLREQGREKPVRRRGVSQQGKGYRKGSVDSCSPTKNAKSERWVARRPKSRFARVEIGKKPRMGPAKKADDRRRKRS